MRLDRTRPHGCRSRMDANPMITRVEAWNFRCLRHIEQPLDRFRILVGGNASGKSTFLSVPRFIRDLLNDGAASAVSALCSEQQLAGYRELLWLREGTELQLAVDVRPPRDLLPDLPDPLYRYEVAIEVPGEGRPRIAAESLLLYLSDPAHTGLMGPVQRALFPESLWSPGGILKGEIARSQRGRHKVVGKTRESGKDYYQWKLPGDSDEKRPWNQSFTVGRDRSALAFIPGGEDEDADPFASARWVMEYLSRRIFPVQLDVDRMRRPSPPSEHGEFAPDGSNLPWAVIDLRATDADRFGDWLRHVRTALHDIVDVQGRVREDDRHAYLVVQYESGLEAPAWMLSDGTLRVLALTLIAYYFTEPSVFLIEEPENGIHPRAIEAVHQSLSSMWEHQVLLASHSPVLLSLAEPPDIVCFARDASGATDVVPGESHPALLDWQREPTIADLNFAGVLG
jgi:hypothetical protein